MSSRFCTVLLIVFFNLIFSANLTYARQQRKCFTADQNRIVDTISTLFTAIGTDDVAKSTPSLPQTFTYSTEASDSTEKTSSPLSRPNMPRANAMNGT